MQHQLIAFAHRAGQRIAYHTCGGMTPILERIAAMGTNAMETFTPPGALHWVSALCEKSRHVERRYSGQFGNLGIDGHAAVELPALICRSST